MIGQSQRVVWPGGEHDFCFAIGQLRALEQRCDAGVAVILTRLIGGQFKVDDIHETLRLGLEGAGMSSRDAVRLIESAYPQANLFDLSVAATRVLAAFISWPTDKGEDVPEGKEEAVTKEQESQSP